MLHGKQYGSAGVGVARQQMHLHRIRRFKPLQEPCPALAVLLASRCSRNSTQHLCQVDLLISVARHDGAQQLGDGSRADEISSVLEDLQIKQATLMRCSSSMLYSAQSNALPLQALGKHMQAGMMRCHDALALVLHIVLFGGQRRSWQRSNGSCRARCRLRCGQAKVFP